MVMKKPSIEGERQLDMVDSKAHDLLIFEPYIFFPQKNLP